MIWITGQTGCLGQELVRQLKMSGQIVADLPRIELGSKEAIDQAVSKILSEGKHPTAVFHCAAVTELAVTEKETERTYAVNEHGTLHLIRALAEKKINPWFCFVSTSHTYGSKPKPHKLTETDPLNPRSVYGRSKVNAENGAALLCEKFNIPYFCARVFSYTAAWQKQTFVAPRLARTVQQSKSGEIMKTGWLGATRDFLDIEDVNRALVLAFEKKLTGTYNVCSGNPTAIREILDHFVAFKKKEDPTFELKIEEGQPRADDVHWLVGSPDKFIQATGFKPSINLQQSLERLWHSTCRE